jgi:hypothetical protein
MKRSMGIRNVQMGEPARKREQLSSSLGLGCNLGPENRGDFARHASSLRPGSSTHRTQQRRGDAHAYHVGRTCSHFVFVSTTAPRDLASHQQPGDQGPHRFTPDDIRPLFTGAGFLIELTSRAGVRPNAAHSPPNASFYSGGAATSELFTMKGDCRLIERHSVTSLLTILKQ